MYNKALQQQIGQVSLHRNQVSIHRNHAGGVCRWRMQVHIQSIYDSAIGCKWYSNYYELQDMMKQDMMSCLRGVCSESFSCMHSQSQCA